METEITIQKDKLLVAYNGASDEQKSLLEAMFGKETFKSENVMDRIKTFEDACKELGNEHPFVKSYEKYVNIARGEENDIIAYLKLRIICAALNEGWKPNFDKEECRYFPWFYIYSKDEYDALSEGEKEECLFARRSSYGSSSAGGVACVSVDYTASDGGVAGGARLAFKKRELAIYCGTQFTDIWADYLFSND